MRPPFINARIPLVAMLCVLATGCLKTRAELREEHEDGGPKPAATTAPPNAPSPPQAAQVQDVTQGPQGSGYAIDEIKGELTRLNGRIEDLERTQHASNADATATANKEDLKKLEIRVVELEKAQAQMIEELKKLQDAQVQQAEATADPSEALNKAKDHYSAGEYDKAIEGFSSVVRHAKGSKLEEALFLRGESYYALKQYKQAIVDYSKFPEKYTHSHYMPQALYKIALSFDALGMRDDARNFYQELAEKYPKSPEAKKARKKTKKTVSSDD